MRPTVAVRNNHLFITSLSPNQTAATVGMLRMKSINIWNIRLNPISKVEFTTAVVAMLNAGRRGIHLTGVNPETVVLAQLNDELRRAVIESALVNIDNMLVAWALRLSGFAIPERAATPDIFEMLLREAETNGSTVYFLGGEQQVIESLVKNVSIEYPQLRVVGYSNGFYSSEEAIVRQISSLRPTFLFVGLPSPMKETFILRNKHRLNCGVCYGVGGAFDAKAGKVRRAPAWLANIGFEGLFRVLSSPSNYGRRVKEFYPAFLTLAWRERNGGTLGELPADGVGKPKL